MSQSGENERHCTTCGSRVGADDVYCRFCGSRLPASQPPSWEGQQEAVKPEPPDTSGEASWTTADAPTEKSSTVPGQPDPFAIPTPEPSDAGYSAYTPAPGYPPAPQQQRRDSKVWWILGAAIVVFLLICCCLLLAIGITASQDSNLREELQSSAQVLALLSA